MTARIDALTDAHRASFPAHVEKYMARGHRATPLSRDEWGTVIQGVRDCYRYAGLDQPVGIILAPSPMAAVVAVHVARRVRVARVERRGGQQVIDVEAGVGDGVRAGVGDGVRAGVGDGEGLLAPYAEWLHEPIQAGLRDAKDRFWAEYHGGNLWSSWHAYASWFRDAGLDLDGDLWDRFAADEARALAGPSWWYQDFVAISDLPTKLHVENRGGAWGMHCEDGPAIEWADGYSLSFWRGTRVPADMVKGAGWDVKRAMTERNLEHRRCAVERIGGRDGWGRIIAEAGWSQVGDPIPDPGNPGQHLTLWHVPSTGQDSDRGLYEQPVRLLHCVNGTVERDGTRHEFGITVPDDITDPLAAASWTYDVTPDEYALITNRR